jgi:hypothetical protein
VICTHRSKTRLREPADRTAPSLSDLLSFSLRLVAAGISESQAIEVSVHAKRARAAGLPQRLKRCVAMCCDAQRRVEEHYDAPRRVALPTVMSISPTRLIDDPNMVQSRGDFKTALLP